MAHMLLTILIIIIIVVALFPIAFTVMFSSETDSCFPIPAFIKPIEATTYYFNTTNHRWYTVTIGDGTNQTIYDGRNLPNHNNPYGDYLNGFDGYPRTHGQYVWNYSYDAFSESGTYLHSDTLLNKTINEIVIYIGKVGNPTGVYTVGIFHVEPTYIPSTNITTSPYSEIPVLVKSFGTGNSGDLLTSNEGGSSTWTELDNYAKTFSINENYTLQKGDIVGIQYTHNNGDADNYIRVAKTTDQEDIGTPEGLQDVSLNGTWVFSDSDVTAVNNHNVDFVLKMNWHPLTTYTLIPLTGHSPNQTPEGRTQCMDTWDIMAVIAILALVIVILILISIARSDRE